MDDGSKVFCVLIVTVGVFFSVLMVLCWNVDLRRTAAIEAAIQHGVNPIDAMCAYQELKNSERVALCAIRAKQ